MRAFSLIEAMVAVAILGVFAALAVPSLTPEVFKAQLNGAAESAAGFVAHARAEAMLSKRCVRVRVDAGPPTQLVMERVNSFDCESATPAAPFIDGTLNPFIEIARLVPESPAVSFALTEDPATPANELRIRPNGRSFSNDGGANPTLNNDDAVFDVTHARLAGADGRRRILYNGNGLLCLTARGQDLLGASPDFSCP